MATINQTKTGNSQFDHLLAFCNQLAEAARFGEVQSLYEQEEEALAIFKEYHDSGCQDDFGNSLEADGVNDRGYNWFQRWLISTSTYGGFDWPRASCTCII